MTESERRRAVRHRPYRDLLVADVLVEESARRISKDPDTAETMARTAEWIAGPPWPAATAVADKIRALACIRQGEARRRLGDGWGAELRLAAAFSILQELPVSEAHWAFCDELATLREEQGRLDEAIALLWQAEALEVRFWGRRIEVSRLVRLGFLYLKQNDLASAMNLFTEVRTRKKRYAAEEDLDLAADLGRAVCLAAAGLAGPAQQVLAESLPSRQRLRERDARLPLEWLECRIAIHLGDLERAVPRLEAVRRWLLDQFRFDQVCLCTLDLAFAYARRGDAIGRLACLLAEVAGLPLAGERPWAVEALDRFREVLEREGGEPVAAAREAAEIARRGRGAGLQAPPDPTLPAMNTINLGAGRRRRTLRA